MIVHIMPDANYSVNFMDYINEHCDKKDHLYIAIVEKSSYYFDYYDHIDNCIVIQSKYDYFKYLPEYRKAERVIIHQLNRPELMFYWLLFDPSIFKKLVWIIWGSDVYDYLYQSKSIKARILEWLRKNFIARVKYIAAYLYEDYLHCKKVYPSDSKYFKVLYPGIIDVKNLREIAYRKKNEDDTVNIVIGNSADPSNDHLAILDYMEKFKQENIQLYFILSYGGNREYIESVKVKANSIFGDKAIFLEELMSEPDFYSFLDDMDIGIFNHKRQQGLGALIHLVYAGKKMFVNSNSSTFAYYNRIGIKMYPTDQIPANDYSDFIAFDRIQGEKNRNGILSELNEVDNLTQWKAVIYDSL